MTQQPSIKYRSKCLKYTQPLIMYCITYLKEELEFNQSGEGGGDKQTIQILLH